ALSTRLLVDTTLALDETVCADMARLKPDCIVADSMAVWGKAAALKLGIPFVSSTTTFAFNRHSAQTMEQSFGDLARMLFSLPKIQKDIKRLRAKGYPVKNVLDLIRNDENTHTVVYTSPEFQPFAETFSDKYAFVGPSVRPAAGQVEKTGEKLIYISMGTVNNKMLPLYKNMVEALARPGYQVVLSVGAQIRPEELCPLPGNVSAFSHVDQIAVLEKADLFFSHCGMNSASESLYFGVPLITLPQTAEQTAVARRAEELGAGLRLEKTDPASILAAAQRVLSDPAYKENAGRIAQSFRRCPGAAGAADKIEQVCGLPL
ncbi:MAG: glucosyltransferase, partial [Oscillospiraceae bacterium]|nr:glucosyltransferase [Oscillospiraceae bacterium]